MRRHVWIACLSEVAVCRATQEAGVSGRIEPAACFTGRRDLDGRLRLRLLLLRLRVIASRSAAAPTPVPPPVASVLEAATPATAALRTPIAAVSAVSAVVSISAIRAISAIAPFIAVEALILLLLLRPLIVPRVRRTALRQSAVRRSPLRTLRPELVCGTSG
jgi:hypothetical protein